MPRLLPPAVAGLLALGLAATSIPAAAQTTTPKVPNFKVENLEGDRVSLADHLGKGPVVLDFWATWCKPCIKELPFVQRIADKYEEHGVKIFAVSIDTPRSQSQVRKFIRSHGYEMEVLMDGDQSVFKKCQGRGTVPYVVVLDPEGLIRYHHTGYRPGDELELEQEIVKLLKELGVDVEGPEGVGEAEAAEPAEDTAAEEAKG